VTEFSMDGYLDALAVMGAVRPKTARPLVVHAADLPTIPSGAVPNPTRISVAGALPTVTFELFRQELPPGGSSDLHRHHHETVHFVIAGHGHTVIEDETVTWAEGDFVYTPTWTWHRHYNDSTDVPARMLGIENSRLLDVLGVNRRQSAGLVTVDEARARFGRDGDG
jgi:mannose-6-phosphate isomerase-like protein (cupin superfamily)